jgi:maltooligosyltrehalose synthase
VIELDPGVAVRVSRAFVMVGLGLLCASISLAQKEKREPLTPAQIDEIREAGIYPDNRIGLYTKFINEHADTIKGLTARGKSGGRAQRLDGELQDLAALMDELGENLDVYSDRKADIRKALKNLSESAPRWLGILRTLAGEPGFELARKEAIESGQDLADQAKRLLTEQTDYFNQHKDESGQERAEPK